MTLSAETAGTTPADTTAPLLSDRPRRRPRGDGDRWSRWAGESEEEQQEAVDRVA